MTTETNVTTAGAPQITDRYSTNWCGYLITGETTLYRSVSAQWQMPDALAGPPNANEYVSLAAIWVGLNGVNEASVCLTQAGADVNAFKFPDEEKETEFDSWYELEVSGDSGETKLGPNYPVAAGDMLSCTITQIVDLTFRIELGNSTRNWNYDQTHTYPPGTSPPLMNSAEIIVEAPVWAAGKIGKLTNFGAVTFQNVTVNGQPLTTYADQAAALTMVNNTSQPPNGNNLLASPGPFDNTFTVTWHNFGSLRAHAQQQL